MFTMMNEARLFVGVQGGAIGDRAYQAALSYANERVQGRVIEQEGEAPIIGHPDVRRMMLAMKAKLMGARAICMATAAASDMALVQDDAEARKAAHARDALLTPIAKSYGSDTGVEAASIGVQVHGGMGFVEETGAAQHYRDARIAPIYEGTNGIQAMDLVGRKLRRDGGQAMGALISDLKSILSQAKDMSGYEATSSALSEGIETLETATEIVLGASEKDALSVATDYLNICADIIGGAYLIKAACNGERAQDPLAANMHKLSQFHAATIMPQAKSKLAALRAGSEIVFDFPLDHLADL